jgi:hypothetical protein
MSKRKKIFHKPDENIPSADDILNYLNEDQLPSPVMSSKSAPPAGSVFGGVKDEIVSPDEKSIDDLKNNNDEQEEALLPAPKMEGKAKSKRKSSSNEKEEGKNKKKYELEKAMLSEPLLSEAVDGYSLISNKEKTKDIINAINRTIAQQTARKKNSIAVMKIAAIFMVVFMISAVFYYLSDQFNSNQLADVGSRKKENISTGTIDTLKGVASKDTASQLAIDSDLKKKGLRQEENTILPANKSISSDGYISNEEINNSGPYDKIVEEEKKGGGTNLPTVNDQLEQDDQMPSPMMNNAKEDKDLTIAPTENAVINKNAGESKKERKKEEPSYRATSKKSKQSTKRYYAPSFRMDEQQQDVSATKQNTIEDGIALYRDNKYAEAKNIFAEIKKTAPADQEALYYYGMSEYKLKSYESALTNLGKVNASSLHYDEARWNIALIYIETGQKDQAIALLKELSKPGNAYSDKASKKLKKFD